MIFDGTLQLFDLYICVLKRKKKKKTRRREAWITCQNGENGYRQGHSVLISSYTLKIVRQGQPVIVFSEIIVQNTNKFEGVRFI